MEPNWVIIERLFQNYLDYNPGRIGGGLNYDTINEWMSDRKKAYSFFSPCFKQDNLKNMETVCNVYGLWLLAKNNKSWLNLYNVGRNALDAPVKLCKLLSFIQQEMVPIEKRVQGGLAGIYKVDGVGKVVLTGLLHTMYPEKYGVWTNTTINALKKLDIIIPLINSTKRGRTYARVNAVLNDVASRLDTDLTYVNGFMWYVAKRLPKTISTRVGNL